MILLVFYFIVIISISEISSDTVDCDCGLSPVVTRLKNSVKVKNNSYPWLARLEIVYERHDTGPFYTSKTRKHKKICGAVILDDHHILTSSYCKLDEHYADYEHHYELIVGYTELPLFKRFSKFAPIKLINPKISVENDLTIFELDKGLPMSSKVMAICLSKIGYEPSINGKLTIAGWGSKKSNIYGKGKATRKARKIFHIIRQVDYDEKFLQLDVYDDVICTGDEGNPVTYFKDGRFFLHGVVKDSGRCGGPHNSPATAVKTKNYFSFIKSHSKACFK